MLGQINFTANVWSQWMGNMFWQVSLLIVLVMFIDMAIRRRVWPHVRYVLWGMVFLKLLIPPTWHMPTGIVSSIQPTISEHIPVQIEQKVLFESVTPASGTAERSQHQAAESATAEKATWQTTLFLIWIAGMLIYVLLLAIQMSRLPKRSQKRHDRDAPEWFNAVLGSTSARLGLKKTPSVIFSRDAGSPAVYGLFRPVLVLPRGYFDDLGREQAEHVLLHELCHLKRGDLWVHWFCILLQIVYWFNPLLILARRQLGHVSEICCDLTVASFLKEKTVAYRETLLSTSRRFLAEAVAPGMGLLGIFEEPFRVVARLKWLERKTWENRKRKIAATIATTLVMVVFVIPMSGHSQLQETNEVRNEKMENPEKIPVPPVMPPVIETDLGNRTVSLIEYTYGPLFENIEVSSEKLERFKELLTDGWMAQRKIVEEMPGDPVHMTQEKIDERLQRTSNVVEEYNRKIAELIGDESYSKYVTYTGRLLESQQVDAFNMNQTAKEMMVTGEQREKLVVAMYQARKIIPGEILSLSDISNQVIEAYLESTKPILSESQLENFHNFLLNEQKQVTPETASNEDVSQVPMESISDSQDGITINMVDADITVLIETISKMTGKSFIIDNNVKGKVNVISPEKLSPEEAYRLFESVLEVNGFALEPAGNVIKVVPVSSATPDPLTMRISLSRTMVSSALENKSGLMKQLVFTSFSENDLKGVLASNLEANSLWRRMGLRNGDVLVAVDGKPLTTVDQMAAFLENLKSSNTVSLEIKRRDQVRSIIYRIQ